MMKLGLYSVSYAGIWYRGEALSLPDLIRKARQLGFAGIELDGKRPHGNPMDLDAAARQEIKRVAAGEGIEIAAVASNNDFTTPVPDHLEPQILMVREQIRLTADLGSKILRVFLAWPGITYRTDGLAHYDVARRRWEEIWRDTTRLEIWESARAAFRELARFAESEGVVLALQNHGPVIRHHQDVIDMVREVDSPAFMACLDAPLMTRQDDDYMRQACLAGRGLQVHSHASGEFKRDAKGRVVQYPYRFGEDVPNYPAFVRAMTEIGYDGYVCFEYCHLALNERNEIQGRDFVDSQAALFLEYFGELLRQAERAAA
ncbi:MAG: sugar phosphate isomerase/epimerase family protein [Inquilinus sp.]|uniref:sugar phosphate isomerase/epimerase family protein n=1 Tax=Inquilinus sp. TaxID=1932117 RepID=UPI003F34F35C